MATSVGYTDDRADSGAVVNPSWLFTTTWIGAPGPVAGELRQLEGLGHHALAGEGGVAVDEQRQHAEAARRSGNWSCLARTIPSTTGSTASRCDGFEANVTGSAWPGAAHEHAAGALVVLHVPRSLDGVGIEVTLELPEDLAVGLAHDVGQDVQPAPVRHARAPLRSVPAAAASSRTASRSTMVDSAPSRPNRFWPT